MMRYYYTYLKDSNKIILTIPSTDEDKKQLEFSYITGGNARLDSHSGK